MILSKLPKLTHPFQNKNEWQTYLEIVSAYFLNRGIFNPIVVEIGVYRNQQKPYYQTFLNARHIGVDINPEYGPDIVGDSRNKETMDRLGEMLKGELIDLLFIDGDHNYGSVKSDYDIYSPFVSHIVALHDIHFPGPADLWKEIITGEDTYIEIGSNHGTPIEPHPNMGIGMVLK